MSLWPASVLCIHDFSDATPSQVPSSGPQNFALQIAELQTDLFVGLHDSSLPKDPIVVSRKSRLHEKTRHNWKEIEMGAKFL